MYIVPEIPDIRCFNGHVTSIAVDETRDNLNEKRNNQLTHMHSSSYRPFPTIETSSRNSEVIHAGLYYPKDSLKSKFCINGKLSIYDYCKSRNIHFNNCGKLIVATRKEQLRNEIARIQDHATGNGVRLEFLTPEQVQELEPNVTSVGALWSPSTAIIDSHSFMVSLLADAESNGATLALHSHVEGGSVEQGKLQLTIDGMDLQCDILINAAGLWASEIAQKLHSEWRPPRQYFAKGNYFRLSGVGSPFSRLVYPVPELNGLGLHATIDYSGNLTKFGPDVEWLHADTLPDDIDLKPSPDRADAFYSEVRKYWNAIPDNSLVPDYAGIRPKLHHPNVITTNGFVDFQIDGPESHKIPGLFHLFGIESPGLTSSIAIGEHIGNIVDGRWQG